MMTAMALTRVTVTVPHDLVQRADGLARRRETSRSAVVAEALQAYLAVPPDQVVRGGRVVERGQDGYQALSDDALLRELRRRLAASGLLAVEAASVARAEIFSRLDYDRARLAELCRRHRIRRLALFGSVLRDDFGPGSDVDVLVEFEPGHTPGLGIADVEDDLSALFGGRRVDLVTEKSLHPLIRERVRASARVQYAG